MVRIAPATDPWRRHFRPSVDQDTFEPGSGGGLLERGLQSLLGGVIEAAVPGIGGGALATLTGQVVGAMLESLVTNRGGSVGSVLKDGVGQVVGEGLVGGETEASGLFGLGQPGLVRVERIRYWVAPRDNQRPVLMRRVDERPAQPVAFVEDLEIRYVTGEEGDVLLDNPPPFVGDMVSAARLGDHIVRSVDVSVRVRSLGTGLAASRDRRGGGAGVSDGFVTRTYRRRIALRVATAGVDRRAWEELMQLNSLPTEIPRIGPLRYLPLPW